MQNLCGHFKDEAIKACEEVCWKKRGRRSRGDTWRWNEEVNEAVSRKKHTGQCVNPEEENKRRYKSIRNKAKKAVSKAKRLKAEEALTELQNCPYGMF